MKKLSDTWQKPTRSDNSGPYCVEVRLDDAGNVEVRNSNKPDAGQVSFTRPEWDAFTGSVQKDGDFTA